MKYTGQLIDKKDNFELVRDQIAAILFQESVNQQALATAEGKDPTQWAFNVYSERSNPWSEFQTEGQATPVVNVWFDSMEMDDAGSDTVERQKMNGRFNVDIYCADVTLETDEGQEPGDEKAAKSAHATARLVRNILMSSINTYLQMRGTVWNRKVQSLTSFQPGPEDAMVQHVLAVRVSFQVIFNELSPQAEPVPLEYVSTAVARTEDGKILFKAEYEYNVLN